MVGVVCSNFRWFTGSKFSAQQSDLSIGQRFTASLTIKNTGRVDAHHSVLLYFIQQHRRVTPEANRLLAFDKVFIAAGMCATLCLRLIRSRRC